jgi:hypothetical protein
MLKNRSISGTYTFSKGNVMITYTGTYELDFLQFYDNDFRGDPLDILECPFVFYYVYENDKKFYVPDFFITSLNLIVEIKDGGDDPNEHDHIKIDREKDALKFKAVIESNKYNFIKIVNKEYGNFINAASIIKERNLSGETFSPLIEIPE